jgi:hypothetical protein
LPREKSAGSDPEASCRSRPAVVRIAGSFIISVIHFFQ